MTKSPAEKVTEEVIRRIFNDGRFYEKVKSGEFITYTKRDSVPKRLPMGEPPGTRSQIVYYYDASNKLVAVVHQYLRPDGSLGASGLPDPKRIVLSDGRVLFVPTKPSKKE